MNGRTAFRVTALVFAGLTILLGVVQARRPAPAPQPVAVAPPVATPVDASLARCQALGEAGARDQACLRAWADQRARFLRPATSSIEKAR